jgi:hypothetical protein
MLIILGIILLLLLLWVVYLMIIGGVGFVVALKGIFTGFRQGWKAGKDRQIQDPTVARLKADSARMKAERLARRQAKKDSKNAR